MYNRITIGIIHLGGLMVVFDRCNGILFVPNYNIMAHNEEKFKPISPWSYYYNLEHDNTLSLSLSLLSWWWGDGKLQALRWNKHDGCGEGHMGPNNGYYVSQ